MTQCTRVKRGRERLTLRIGSKEVKLDWQQTLGFERLMELRGLNEQDAFDLMMASPHRWPWKVVERLGRRIARRRILEDPKLGILRRTSDGQGRPMVYRTKGNYVTSLEYV